METETIKQTTLESGALQWEMPCSECDDYFITYSWGYDDLPIEFCCSEECYETYESVESKRDRRLKLILKDEI